MLQVWISPQETDQPEGGVLIVVSAGYSGGAQRGSAIYLPHTLISFEVF